MGRTENTTRNIFWGFINKIVNIVMPFIIRTVMIYSLGTLYLGLNSLYTSILNVLSLAEAGFGTALAFCMYKPIADGDKKTVCALLNFYKNCYRVIGCIVFVIGAALIPFIRFLISGEYPSDINLYLLYLIYLFNTVVSYFLFAYKKSLLIANQRADIDSNISSITIFIQYLAQIIILALFKNYYFYIIFLPAGTILNNLLSAFWANRIFPQYVCKGNLSKSEFSEIKIKVEGLIFQRIGNVVLSSVDNIVISAFLGLNILTIYNNYYYIITAIFGFLTVIQGAMKPSVGNSLVKESMGKNFSDFKKFNFIYMWIVAWSSTCLLCLFQPFMKLWMGYKLMLPFYMVILLALYFFVFKWCDMLYVYQEAAGIWWETRFIPIIAAAVNLIINIVLVIFIGLPGIVISTIVSVLFVYNLGYAVIFFRIFFKSKYGLQYFILRQSYYFIISCMAAGVTYFFCEYVAMEGILEIFLKGVLCVIIPNIIMIILYKGSPEFDDTLDLLKSIVRLHKER